MHYWLIYVHNLHAVIQKSFLLHVPIIFLLDRKPSDMKTTRILCISDPAHFYSQ